VIDDGLGNTLHIRKQARVEQEAKERALAEANAKLNLPPPAPRHDDDDDETAVYTSHESKFHILSDK
jgi:hypothetical protein